MLAAIRVRGKIKVSRKIGHTLKHLNLLRVNHLVILPENAYSLGQLKKAQDYLTFGVINASTLARLLEKRARLSGQKRLDKAMLEKQKLKSFEAAAEALIQGKTTLKELGVKKVFRLRPPRKGFERAGTRRSFKEGGALGDRGEKISQLIARMI